MDRRRFVLAAAASGLAAGRAVAASDRVRVAIMGVRGRGKALTRAFAARPDVDVPYLCDVDSRVFGPARDAVVDAKGAAPELISDIREALDDPGVDAVAIAAPDHWHAPATLLACEAGKDVYVEKPASHNLREGRMMVEAALRHKRVVQLGTQARSRPTVRRAAEYVQSGKIGRVLAAKAWNLQMRDDIGHKEDAPAPAEVDYETWTGPAPKLPFNENRFHYNWHWHWNFGTGDAGNDGVHQIDMARWALGVETPSAVGGLAGKLYFDDDQQTPDTMNITFDHGGRALIFEMRIWNPYEAEGGSNAVEVYGSDGFVRIGRDGFEAFDSKRELVHSDKDDGGDATALHVANFVECIRTRERPNADIEIGHVSSLHAHLGNIVAKTGRTVRFDSKSEKVVGDEEAAALLGREYRKHWSTPKGV